jgi:hypothetical protein
MAVIITNVMVTNVCSGSSSGIEEMMMSKSEVSEMQRAQLGNASTRRISGSADHTGVLTPSGNVIGSSMASVITEFILTLNSLRGVGSTELVRILYLRTNFAESARFSVCVAARRPLTMFSRPRPMSRL